MNGNRHQRTPDQVMRTNLARIKVSHNQAFELLIRELESRLHSHKKFSRPELQKSCLNLVQMLNSDVPDDAVTRAIRDESLTPFFVLLCKKYAPDEIKRDPAYDAELSAWMKDPLQFVHSARHGIRHSIQIGMLTESAVKTHSAELEELLRKEMLADVRSKIFALLYLMRGTPYDTDALGTPTRPSAPIAKGRADTSIITTLGSVPKLDSLIDVPFSKVKELARLMRTHGITFTGMYNVRDFPDETEIDAIIKLVDFCTRGPDIGGQGKAFSKQLFSSIAGMLTQRTILDRGTFGPMARDEKEKRVEEVFENLEAFVKEIETITGGVLDKELLSSITGMLNGRGIPKLTELREFITEVKAITGGVLDKKLLSSITGMMTGKGIPKLTELREFITEVKAITGGVLDKELLSSITGMMTGKGIPRPLRTFINFRDQCLAAGGRDALQYVCSSSSGMGMPTPKQTQGVLKQWRKKNGK